MADLIIILIIVAVVGAAVGYIIKAKKSGAKCIGCPVEGCSSKHGSSSGCGCGCGCDSDSDSDSDDI